uniref:Uncharacterized protein n=1 Tax=Kalanchoe fedtschenkoi TaxID=63787 RepID=A0A7N0T3H4_KALFE
MDHIMNVAGSYWFNQKATKQLDSFGNDMNSLTESIEGGAKWLANKVKGKIQKSLVELLKEYEIPVGIFPRDATNYEFNGDTNKLTIFINSICEVGYKDSSVQRFCTIVSAHMEKGKLTEIEGMKTKMMFIWVKVSSIMTQGSLIYFTAGIKKTRSRDDYELSKPGVRVDNF